jgi:hypothetical protein
LTKMRPMLSFPFLLLSLLVLWRVSNATPSPLPLPSGILIGQSGWGRGDRPLLVYSNSCGVFFPTWSMVAGGDCSHLRVALVVSNDDGGEGLAAYPLNKIKVNPPDLEVLVRRARVQLD